MDKTLNDPLSGEEIKEIILQRISAALDKNSTLTRDISYAGFGLKFAVEITFARSLTKNTIVWGEEPIPAEQVTASAREAGEYDANGSPNVVRQEHDLAIPVMVSTPNGPQRRKVRFSEAAK